ncbi:MAG: NAD+ synthase [Holosporales bacterium]|jgi:NAD+ synthase
MLPASFTICQVRSVVGAIAYNRDTILERRRALAGKTDMIIFPECFISGYPADDLWLRPSFIEACHHAVRHIAAQTQPGDPAVLLGCPWREPDGRLSNAALLIDGSVVQVVARKHILPNTGVFDEQRYFTLGGLPDVVLWKGIRLGVLICEDLWHRGPAAHLRAQGTDLLITLNASPWNVGKHEERLTVARKAGLPLLYANLLAGQDDVVFDGGGFALGGQEDILSELPLFSETTAHFLWDKKNLKTLTPLSVRLKHWASIYRALVFGLEEHARNNGFSKVVLGLSGGMDSALVAALAADALGAKNVATVMLPTKFTSRVSLEDAALVAENLGAAHKVVPIDAVLAASDAALPSLTGTAAENIQARVRGMLLMAISNQQNRLLLATGNKSEFSTGYTTLYGDMCGGYAPLKDVYKTDVYALARWRNEQSPVFPERLLCRAPSAELRDDQRDEDTLPPYPVLDNVLKALVEREESQEQLLIAGYPEAIVRKTAALLHASEHKRRQSPPGPKVSRRALGRERRFPVTYAAAY